MKLNQDPKMISIMENDLRSKVQAAIDANPELRMFVAGVFSVDDLEQQMESDLGGNVGVGVQFAGSARMAQAGSASSNPAQGNTARGVMFNFTIILAVPSGPDTGIRHDATTLLSTLRMAIFGKAISIAIDRTSRTWEYVGERPEVGASTATMLYYSQAWQVALMNHGTAAVS